MRPRYFTTAQWIGNTNDLGATPMSSHAISSMAQALTHTTKRRLGIGGILDAIKNPRPQALRLVVVATGPPGNGASEGRSAPRVDGIASARGETRAHVGQNGSAMTDMPTAAANEPQYDPSLERVHNELAWLREEYIRDPKPSKPMEGFRRWKMRNLLSRLAAAQTAGHHELAFTQRSADGTESWVCTCGLIVPTLGLGKFNRVKFLAAPGHRAMPEAPDWDPSLDDEIDEERAGNSSTNNTSADEGEQ